MKYNHDLYHALRQYIITVHDPSNLHPATGREVPVIFTVTPEFKLLKPLGTAHVETAQLVGTLKTALYFVFDASGVGLAEVLDILKSEAEDVLAGGMPLTARQLVALATLAEVTGMRDHADEFIRLRVQMDKPVTTGDIVGGIGLLCVPQVAPLLEIVLPQSQDASILLAHLRTAVRRVTWNEDNKPTSTATELFNAVFNAEMAQGVQMYAMVARNQEADVETRVQSLVTRYKMSVAAARKEVLKKIRYDKRRDAGLIRKPGPKFKETGKTVV